MSNCIKEEMPILFYFYKHIQKLFIVVLNRHLLFLFLPFCWYCGEGCEGTIVGPHGHHPESELCLLPPQQLQYPSLLACQHVSFPAITRNLTSMVRDMDPHSFMRISIQLFFSTRIRILLLSLCRSGSS